MKLSLQGFIEVMHAPLELDINTNVESIIYAMRLVSPETEYFTELTLKSKSKQVLINAMLALEKDAQMDYTLDSNTLDFMIIKEEDVFLISIILQGRDGLTFLKTLTRLSFSFSNEDLVLEAVETVHEKAKMTFDFSVSSKPKLTLVLDQENLESLRATVLALGDFLSGSEDFLHIDYDIFLT